MDGQTVLVALIALCVVNLVLIWQVATLIDRVNEVQYEAHAVAMWLIRREARNEDGDSNEA